MGREVRRVPVDWKHPQRRDGRSGHQPLYDTSFKEAVKEWKDGFVAWENGHNAVFDRPREESDTDEFWEYNGDPPDREYYRPEWPDETRTHLMMYETTSEGTPISPAMETPEGLAQWLVDNNASAFGSETASYKAWLRVAKGGFAPSAMISDSGIQSGVEALTQESQ